MKDEEEKQRKAKTSEKGKIEISKFLPTLSTLLIP